MSLEEIKRSVSVTNYLEQMGNSLKRLGGGICRVNPCPLCKHKDCFTVYDETNSFFCFSCQVGGDIVNLVEKIEGLETVESIKQVKRMAGDMSKIKIKPPAGKMSGQTPVAVAVGSVMDFTDLVTQYYHSTTDQERQYFLNRGISKEMIEKYKLCFGKVPLHDGRETERRALFPVWENGRCIYFTGRSLKKEAKPQGKYLNPAGIDRVPFNRQLFKQGGVIPVVEGVADALAIETVSGLPVFACMGAGDKMITEAMEGAKGVTVLAAFDNDEAGQKMCEKVKVLSVEYTSLVIPSEYKDVSAWGQVDPDGLKEAILQKVEGVQLENTVAGYLSDFENGFLKEFQKHKTAKRLKTGFPVLDEILNGGIYPGLFVLGGPPGVGKTAFSMQIADTIAGQGVPVLFVSLEMSRYELVCRSIARIMKADGHNNCNTGKVLNGETDPEILGETAKRYGENIGKNLRIKDGCFAFSAEDIRKEVENVNKIIGRAPVLFVDYLQILKSMDPRMTDKAAIDMSVKWLKGIATDYDIPVFCMAAYNRESNKTGEMEQWSFRDSSSIEYSADCLMGISKKNKDETGEKIGTNLKIVKNRRGKGAAKFSVDWWPAYNLYHNMTRG